ncbi:Oar protein [Granulicella sibirica]|uniref:Oar protein n=1 Tax=Granulicella sibirica TaxID=2479048 RepID=A0A4Q0SZR9_9BACT|nr:Oar protein [Granulicella sibirica]
MLIALLAFSANAIAQSGVGAIQGTIQDSTGAVLPGALVHVVNQSTAAAIDTKANDSGFYSVPSLFTGNYTLTFSAPGMKKYETSLELQVAQTAIINPLLTPGNVTEQVTVTGDAVQLATYDSGTISATLDNSRIAELPVNGRFLLSLAGLTTPGLEAGGTRANGLLGEALEYVQDGAPMTNRNFGGEGNSTQAQLPDPDGGLNGSMQH